MKDYKPSVHDVVFIMKEDLNESVKELGLEVNKDYLVTYIFADGGCILYDEEVKDSGYIEVSEYILEEEDVNCLSFIYNYIDEGLNEYSKEEDKDYLYLEDGGKAEVTYDTWVEHDLMVGDYVYFKDVELIKFYNEADLKNNERYEVTGFSEHNNAPIINSPIGDFELYPLEVMYLNLDEDYIKDRLIKDAVDGVKQRGKKGDINVSKKERDTSKLSSKEVSVISDMLDKFAFDNAMNKALENECFEVAQLISDDNEYYKAIAKNSEN